MNSTKPVFKLVLSGRCYSCDVKLLNDNQQKVSKTNWHSKELY